MRDRTGQVIAGRYRIAGLLERGGQSEVYRARDLADQAEVAIKVLSAHLVPDAQFRERMAREAHALAHLEGTACVRVLDEACTRDGAICLVMELLRGANLEHYLARTEARGERAGPAWLIALLDPIVHTLDIAHSVGIIHRDLKPANLFVIDEAAGGGARLLDFGFAKFLRLGGLTQQGFVAGSPSYIAPEGWRGNPPAIDHRADVYSLAAVMFRALGGQPPFAAPDLRDLLELVTTAPRPSLVTLRPDLPAPLDEWVWRALAIEPKDRFQSVGAMWRGFVDVFR
jgi:eukaryotic-like serine/threonine-protein kinase